MLNALDLDPATFRPAGARVTPRENAALRALGYKWCPTCRAARPVEEFGRNSRTSDGRSGRCGECCRLTAESARVRHRALKIDPYADLSSQRCPGCSRDLPRPAFSRDHTQANGLSSRCRDCHRVIAAAKCDGYRATWTAPDADPYTGPLKRCPGCRQTRPRTDFQTAAVLAEESDAEEEEATAPASPVAL